MNEQRGRENTAQGNCELITANLEHGNVPQDKNSNVLFVGWIAHAAVYLSVCLCVCGSEHVPTECQFVHS